MSKFNIKIKLIRSRELLNSLKKTKRKIARIKCKKRKVLILLKNIGISIITKSSKEITLKHLKKYKHQESNKGPRAPIENL